MNIEELEVTLKMLNIGYYHTVDIFDKKAMYINIGNGTLKELEELRDFIQSILNQNNFKYYLNDYLQKFGEAYIRIDEE